MKFWAGNSKKWIWMVNGGQGRKVGHNSSDVRTALLYTVAALTKLRILVSDGMHHFEVRVTPDE